jgi:hypothetical protein
MPNRQPNYLYLVLKNLVLWARSEVFGYASQSFNRNNGMMDEWNGGLRNTVLLIRDTWFLEISIWQSSVFSAQYSSVPLFQHFSMFVGDLYCTPMG